MNIQLNNHITSRNISCKAIFTHVSGMKQVAPIFVLKLLNFLLKYHHTNITEILLNEATDDSELPKKVIPGDETMFYGYAIKTKNQSSPCNLPEE